MFESYIERSCRRKGREIGMEGRRGGRRGEKSFVLTLWDFELASAAFAHSNLEDVGIVISGLGRLIQSGGVTKRGKTFQWVERLGDCLYKLPRQESLEFQDRKSVV